MSNNTIPIKTYDNSIFRDWCIKMFSGALPIGTIVPIICNSTYIPKGMWPCDGRIFEASLYHDLWDNFLTGANIKLATCTFAQYDTELSTYGRCGMIGIDTATSRFRVPYMPDGNIITNAVSSSRIGESFNESLPNITGSCGGLGGSGDNISGAVYGAFYKNTSGQHRTRTGSEDGREVPGSLLDASRSSSTYQTGAKVQMANTSIRYFIQLTTGEVDKSSFDWGEVKPIIDAKQDPLTFSSDFVVDDNRVELNKTPLRPANGNYIVVSGYNANGALGVGHKTNLSITAANINTELITHISNIKKTAYTTTDSIAIGLDGELYMSGTMTGTLYYQRMFFTQKWVDVAASRTSFILLDDEGHIYTLGLETDYELGHGPANISRYAPQRVLKYKIAAVGDINKTSFTDGSFIGVIIKQVEGLPKGFLILDSNGNMFVSGTNGVGIYGVGSSNDNLDHSGYFVKIPRFANIKYISGGGVSVSTRSEWWLAVDTDGDVWGCGYNSKYNLGNNGTTAITTPTKVLTGKNIKKVSCSALNYSLALTTTGRVYYTGKKEHWFGISTDNKTWSCVNPTGTAIIDIQANDSRFLVMYDTANHVNDNAIYELSTANSCVGYGTRFNGVKLATGQYMMSWITSKPI